jgi:hypothetical protein
MEFQELSLPNFHGVCTEEGLEGITVEVLKYPTSIDWQWVKFLALNTIGRRYIIDDGKPLSDELKVRYLTSEHSPIRYLQFIIRMHIPYCDSMEFARHKNGVEHFIQSQRNDRQDKYDRYEAPQGSYVTHVMVINAQELMFMARKRLCNMAAPNARKIMEMIKTAVLKTNAEFKSVLVKNCEYIHKCPEFKPCGYWKVQAIRRNLAEDPDRMESSDK